MITLRNYFIAIAFLLVVFAGAAQWISYQAAQNSADCARLDRKNDLLRTLAAIRNARDEHAQIEANDREIVVLCGRAQRNEQNSTVLMILTSVFAAMLALGIGLKPNA